MKTKLRLYLFILSSVIVLYSSEDLRAQNQNRFEISAFFGPTLSFSHPEDKSRYHLNSPALFGTCTGFKLEYCKEPENRLWAFNTSYTSLYLNVSEKIRVIEQHKSAESRMENNETFHIWSLGAKRYLKWGQYLDFYMEAGERMHISQNHINANSISIYDHYLDSTLVIKMNYSPGSLKKINIVPYLAAGLEFSHKKFKLGVQFWYQRSFTPLFKYNLYVRYGSDEFKTRVVSYGAAFGAQLELKLLSF